LATVAYLIGANVIYFLLLKLTYSKVETVKTEKSTAEDLYLLNADPRAVEGFRGHLLVSNELKSVLLKVPQYFWKFQKKA